MEKVWQEIQWSLRVRSEKTWQQRMDALFFFAVFSVGLLIFLFFLAGSLQA